jgi:hypothetical protein
MRAGAGFTNGGTVMVAQAPACGSAQSNPAPRLPSGAASQAGGAKSAPGTPTLLISAWSQAVAIFQEAAFHPLDRSTFTSFFFASRFPQVGEREAF